jgi:hypothetical protein
LMSHGLIYRQITKSSSCWMANNLLK